MTLDNMKLKLLGWFKSLPSTENGDLLTFPPSEAKYYWEKENFILKSFFNYLLTEKERSRDFAKR